MTDTPIHQIRASFTATTVRVYQAYSDAIADSALAAGRFVSPPFKLDRMTWIKPSFLWMMYRSGWATKEGQSRVLGIDMTRSGFEWALEHACLSSYRAAVDGPESDWRERLRQSPVRVQWDPERDLELSRLGHRTIQIGLRDDAVRRYVQDWIVRIEDMTERIVSIRELLREGRREVAARLLPVEIAMTIGTSARIAIGLDD